MNERRPLSVIVGSSDARATVTDCLARLVPQCEAVGAELVVVDNSTDGTDALVRERFPSVRLIRSRCRYIPELWAVGIAATTGEVVALTTAHAVPAADWAEQVLRAHAQRPEAGIGGAIENAPTGSLTDWAIYFCRYSRFMRPFEAGPEPEIAADNAAYKRVALDGVHGAWVDGFWEPPVHAALRENGHDLWRSPDVVVYHVRSFSLGGFLKNRLRHGRQFGRDRAAGQSPARRLGLALRAPLVPAVLLGRVAREVIGKRRHLGPFLGALPLIVVFYLAWTGGELAGYVAALASRTPRS